MTQERERLLVCLGDSITAGQVSANYVKLLTGQWKRKAVRVENRGVNGDLAYNVAARLDEVIALQPDALTLLVGTNDVNSHYDDKWLARYMSKTKSCLSPHSRVVRRAGRGDPRTPPR
jgi:lysophospholipase L1-like esterase